MEQVQHPVAHFLHLTDGAGEDVVTPKTGQVFLVTEPGPTSNSKVAVDEQVAVTNRRGLLHGLERDFADSHSVSLS